MKEWLVVCFAVIALLTVDIAVSAETGTESWALPELVVTASRVPRDLQSEPWALYTGDAGEMVSRLGRRTTADILRDVPSVMVQKTANAQTSPFIRGFTGYRTLALVDGIRLNNAAFRSGPNQYWNTIDPYSIDRYELLLGPGAVQYGSDAVGGVLNVLTPDAPDWTGATIWSNTLQYRGATAERSHIGRWSTRARLSPAWGFAGGATWKRFGDVEGGEDVGRQQKTGYDEWAADGKVQYFIADDAVVTLAHQSVRQEDAWRTHRTVFGRIDWEGLTHGNDLVHRFDQARDLTYLRLDVDRPLAHVDQMQVTVSRHAHGEERERVFGSGRRTVDGFDVGSYGASLQLQSTHAGGSLLYGGDYYRDRVTSFERDIGVDGTLTRIGLQGPLAARGDVDLAGAFAQNTVTLGDDWVDVLLGARYTYSHADARRVEDPATGEPISLDKRWDALTGSARLLLPLTPDRRHVVYTGLSQGFRAPTLHDLTSFGVARSDELEIPSPDLDNEEYLTYEIGWKSRTRNWVVQLGYYYTQIDGLIVKTATGRERDGFREVTKSNAGDGYVQGAEAAVRWRGHPQWTGWVSGSWQEGKADVFTSAGEKTRQQEYISRIMPPTAHIGIRWQTVTGRYWLECSGDFAAKADRLSAGDRRDTQRIPPGGTPGYAVASLRAGTALSEELTVALSIENLLDEDYRIHGSGINEPGRNVILTAEWQF
jgi:hemoglobin/transferrin/lactoferrin receptor protein